MKKTLMIAAALALIVPAMATAQGVMFVTGGQVGIGTDTPATKLHVKDGDFTVEQSVAGTPAILKFTTASTNWDIFQNGNTGRLVFRATGFNNGALKFDRTAVDNLMKLGVDAANQVTIGGNLVLTGTCTGCDAVLTPEWELESIEAHAEAMHENSYLPAVGPTPEGPTSINVFEKTTAILQELEKAHIYIAQLNETVKQLEAQVAKLEK